MALCLGLFCISSVYADVYQMQLDLNQSELCGELTLEYTNTANVSLKELALRLDNNLGSQSSTEVLSVVDSQQTPLSWHTHAFKFGKWQSKQGQMIVTLAQPVSPQRKTTLTIHFKTLNPKALGSRMITLQDDPYHSLDAWYPKAMSWIKGKWSVNDDRPSDYLVDIELPAAYAIASTGTIDRHTTTDDRQSVTLSAHQVRGFSIYGNTQWQESSHQAGQQTIHLVLPKGDEAWATRICEAAEQSIAFYEQHYGSYPSQHLDIVCIGSMKDRAHGSSAACNVIMLWLNKQFEDQYQELIAHEIAHQYLGCDIIGDRNEIGWVTVGLGLMMERHYALAHQRDYSGFQKTFGWFYLEAERRHYDTRLSQDIQIPLTSNLPRWSSGWNMSLQHGKAMHVFLMLQELMGKESFEAMLKEVINTQRGQCLNQIKFMDLCSKAASQPLNWFWATWVHGRDTLDYALEDITREKNGWNITIKRLGKASYPITVEAKTRTGNLIQKRIDHTKETNRIAFNTREDLKSVTLDPQRICPDTDRSNNRKVF